MAPDIRIVAWSDLSVWMCAQLMLLALYGTTGGAESLCATVKIEIDQQGGRADGSSECSEFLVRVLTIGTTDFGGDGRQAMRQAWSEEHEISKRLGGR